MARFKEAFVVDHVLFSNDTFQWNITFIRLVHDWEVEAEMVASFFNLLYSFMMNQGGEDRICWTSSKR